MKIVVYNSYEQYALSRAEIETIRDVLPVLCWARIRELHIAHSHPQQAESFEWDEGRQTGYLIAPVKQKTVAHRTNALRELLIGLARVKARSRFFVPLRASERADYSEFVNEWLPKCEVAIDRSYHGA